MAKNDTREPLTPLSASAIPAPARAPRLSLALIVLVVGLFGSLLAAWTVQRTIDDDAIDAFNKVCDEITLQIRERLTAYALLLQGGQALFAASDSVDRDEWRTYAQTVRAEETVPGHLGFGFTLLVRPDELEAHVAAVRAEGFPDYRITPPGPRDPYSSILYLEPFDERNRRAFGYDMFSEPVRRAAMEQARDTGEPALTGKVILVQEGETDIQAGTLMYVPVYRRGAPLGTLEERRAALLGWVYNPYRMRDLMSGIVPDWQILGRETLDLHIYDGKEPTPEHLLFDSQPVHEHPQQGTLLHTSRTINFNGRDWLLVFDGEAAEEQIDYLPAWITLAGGLVISTLLFGLLIALSKRSEAVRLAEGYAAQIRGMAFYDSLTGLPNRRLLDDRLGMALAAGHRKHMLGALLMLDLDNFKPLNDEHGHAAGDLLLKEVARRLLACVRETDTVARLGGDEFVIVLPVLGSDATAARAGAMEVAAKILASLARPYAVQTAPDARTIEHHCTCSIGITLFSGDESNHSAILKRADAAMYDAKQSGRNRLASSGA